GVLLVAPAGGLGAGPGLNAAESLIVNGTAPALTTGNIVAPSILGQNNDANKSGDFLTYGAGTGFQVATYTSTNVDDPANTSATVVSSSGATLTGPRAA